MRALFTAMAHSALTDAARSNTRRTPAQGRGPTRRRRRRFTSGRRIAAAAIGGLVSLALLAGTAHAKGSVYLPAPSYPNSSLAIKVLGKPRAGGIVKVVVSGNNAPFLYSGATGEGDYIDYQLDAFAQNGKVLPNCPRSFMAELQNEVNLGISRVAQGLTEGPYGPFDHLIAFRTSPRIRKVVVCAYSRMIDDDAAVSALGFKLRPPRCSCRRH
jgi:hypothetical protein